VLITAGIQSELRNQYLAGAMGELPMMETWPQLYVDDADEHTALRPWRGDAAAPKRRALDLRGLAASGSNRNSRAVGVAAPRVQPRPMASPRCNLYKCPKFDRCVAGQSSAGATMISSSDFIAVRQSAPVTPCNPEPEAASPAAARTVRLLGESAAMREVLRLIERVGGIDTCVLLTGESGTGKQLAAQAIHEGSPRHSGPLIVFQCYAAPPALVERELFGAFERADGGTLLLDEFTELPWEAQARLLRVLESQKDWRVIAATNACPLQAVEAGRLRADLLYRLAEFPIAMPPLRDRGGDVHLLAEYFLAALNCRAGLHKRLSAASLGLLERHAWPGNVRELKNCVERAFILGDHELELTVLSQAAALHAPAEAPEDGLQIGIRVGSRLDAVERTLIEATLDHFRGDKRRSAGALGCSLKTLYNKLNGYSQGQTAASS
jgi:two-component system, NtrC family, response regulator HydG